MVCDERPDCCDVMAVNEQWITTLDDIQRTQQYIEFVNHFKDNTFSGSSLDIYAKFIFQIQKK